MSTQVGGISTKNDRKDGKSGTPPSQQAGAPNAGASKKSLCLDQTSQYCQCGGEGCAKYTSSDEGEGCAKYTSSDEGEFGGETQDVNHYLGTLRQDHEKAMQDQLNALKEKEKEAKEHEAATKKRKELADEIALHTQKMQMEIAAKLLKAQQQEANRQAQKLQNITAGFHTISQELENTFNNLNKLCCKLGNNATEKTIADATQTMRTLETLYAKIDIPALNKQLQLVTIPATETTTPSGSGSIGNGGKRKLDRDNNAGGDSSKKQKRLEGEKLRKKKNVRKKKIFFLSGSTNSFQNWATVSTLKEQLSGMSNLNVKMRKHLSPCAKETVLFTQNMSRKKLKLMTDQDQVKTKTQHQMKTKTQHQMKTKTQHQIKKNNQHQVQKRTKKQPTGQKERQTSQRP
jgi:hypothetical protein